MNQKLKRLIRQLGEAIHETVSESEDIAGVVRDIREEGFDVLLMLEATIGLNELEEAEAAAGEASGEDESKAPFNSHDLNFLKSLRITLEEEQELSPSAGDEDDASSSAGSPS